MARLSPIAVCNCLFHLLVLVRMPPVSALRRSLKAEVHPIGGVPQGNGTILRIEVGVGESLPPSVRLA